MTFSRYRASDGSRAGSRTETVRATAQRSVRHFLADFEHLAEEFPGLYPRLIVRGEGAHVWDEQGRRLLDAGNHLGVCQVGHGRSEIAERVAQQIRELEFSALDSGISHPNVVELAQSLGEIVLVDDPMFSFTSSGSEANELAFKIARAYHARRGEEERVVVLSRDGSYHGSSFAAMSATGAPAFQSGYGPLVPGFVKVAQPSPGRCGYCDPSDGCKLACADALERSIAELGSARIAAVIAEPVAILQAVKIPHPDYWPRVQAICRDSGALLILDEVVTGFGRTGRMFGGEHWEIDADIVTVAKGLTSGYIPMGATIVSRRVEEAFASEPLLHLNTYAGHPVACAAALANIEILMSERLPERAATLESVLREELEKVAARAARVVRISVIGLLSSIELDVRDLEDPAGVVTIVRHAMYENGVLARCAASGDILTVVFYPPLVVAESDIELGVAAVGEAIDEVLG